MHLKLHCDTTPEMIYIITRNALGTVGGRKRKGGIRTWVEGKGNVISAPISGGGNKSKKIKESERCWLDDDISGPLPQTIITKIALG